MLEKLFGDNPQEKRLPCKKCGTLVYRQSDLDLSAVYCYECQQRYGLRDSSKAEQGGGPQSEPSGQNSSLPPPPTDNQGGSSIPPENNDYSGAGAHCNRAILTDVRIPFGRMVLIILKWMLASIPAVLLMWLIIAGVTLLFGAGIGGCAALLSR